MGLQRRSRLSKRDALDLVLTLAKHGNHSRAGQIRTGGDVERFFAANGYKLDAVTRDVREGGLVPLVENFAGATWHVMVQGESSMNIARHDNVTGQDTPIADGPGSFTLLAYWGIFETAKGALDRAVQNSSYPDFLVAVTQGVGSVKHYIRHRVEIWNRDHPGAPLVDSAQQKVRFEDKVDGWVPITTGGQRLAKGTIEWQDFLKIRDIRDDVNVHPKSSSFGMSNEELASSINLFRIGVAGLLIRLHILFDEPIPGAIVRARYEPAVVVTAPAP